MDARGAATPLVGDGFDQLALGSRVRSSTVTRFGVHPQHARRITGDDCVGRDIAGHDAAGADDGMLADHDARKNRRAGADRCSRAHQRGFDSPVGGALQLSVRVVARGYRSLMNMTPWPMKTRSSIVTPSQMKVWLEILQRRPTVAFFWISTNAPIWVSSPIAATVQVEEAAEPDVRPQLHIRRDRDVVVECVVHGPVRVTPPAYAAPLPEITARGVASRILMSIHSE